MISVEETESLKDLAARYGHQRVWDAGIELHGHPPTWELTPLQHLQLQHHLKGK